MGARLRFNRWLRRYGSDCFRVGISRLDLLAGYRYLRLHEDVLIGEASTWTVVTEGEPPEETVSNITDYLITDVFDTQNKFHGGEIGLLFEHEYGDCWLEILAKVALGNNRQVVSIDGGSETTEYQVVTYEDPDSPPDTTDPVSSVLHGRAACTTD